MKKNIIRFAATVMTAAIILSSTGCGKGATQKDSTEAELDRAIDEYEKEEAERAKKHEENETKKAAEKYEPAEPTDELKAADPFEPAFQIKDVVYTLPMKVSDFLESNEEFSTAANLDEILVSNSDDPYNKYKQIIISYGDFQTSNHTFSFNIVVENETNGDMPIKDCTIKGINSKDTENNILFPCNIKIGDSIDNADEIFKTEYKLTVDDTYDRESNRRISCRSYTETTANGTSVNIGIEYFNDDGIIKYINYLILDTEE